MSICPTYSYFSPKSFKKTNHFSKFRCKWFCLIEKYFTNKVAK